METCPSWPMLERKSCSQISAYAKQLGDHLKKRTVHTNRCFPFELRCHLGKYSCISLFLWKRNTFRCYNGIVRELLSRLRLQRCFQLSWGANQLASSTPSAAELQSERWEWSSKTAEWNWRNLRGNSFIPTDGAAHCWCFLGSYPFMMRLLCGN